jgi:hypothetical protein
MSWTFVSSKRYLQWFQQQQRDFFLEAIWWLMCQWDVCLNACGIPDTVFLKWLNSYQLFSVTDHCFVDTLEVTEITLLIIVSCKESQIQIGVKQHISVTVGLITLVIVLRLLHAVSENFVFGILRPSPFPQFFFFTICEKTKVDKWQQY